MTNITTNVIVITKANIAKVEETAVLAFLISSCAI